MRLKKELTLKDISKMAGVSHTTVSRVLNGAGNVKPETYERIMSICRENGFTMNAVARQLKTRTSNTIGIIMPDITNAHTGALIRNIEWKFRQQDFNVSISSSFFDYRIEEQNIQALLESRADGIIIFGVGDQTYQCLQKYVNRIPIVFMGDNVTENLVSKITVDNYQGTVIGTRYLLELGHRHLAFLGGRESSITHRKRRAGFMDTVVAAGVEYEAIPSVAGDGIEDGYRTAAAYFESCKKRGKAPATGLMSINDSFALGIMQGAMEFGIEIPSQMSLIGFDDISYASLPKIQLTTMAQPREALSEFAVNTLIKLIHEDRARLYSEILEPKLIQRETCVRLLE